jgi:hypothetical protein
LMTFDGTCERGGVQRAPQETEKIPPAFEQKYERELRGEALGQFNCDFAIKRDGKEVGKDVYATNSIVVAKKMYIDVLTGTHKTTGETLSDYHVRMKGVPGEPNFALGENPDRTRRSSCTRVGCASSTSCPRRRTLARRPSFGTATAVASGPCTSRAGWVKVGFSRKIWPSRRASRRRTRAQARPNRTRCAKCKGACAARWRHWLHSALHTRVVWALRSLVN